MADTLKHHGVTENGDAIAYGLPLVVRNLRFNAYRDEGAYGVVFRAWDSMLDRDVAVKVYSLDSEKPKECFERGIAEVRKLAKLHHPAIVEIYSTSEDEYGRFFYVMEWLEGENLGEFLGNRQLDFVNRLRIWTYIASGLHHAQMHGIYHSDLTSRNIMVTRVVDETDRVIGYRVKLIDFGTSSLFSTDRQQSFERTSSMLQYIVKLLFQEGDINSLMDVDLTKLHPDFALCACIAWVEFLLRDRMLRWEVERGIYAKEDFGVRSEVVKIAELLAHVPLFKLERIFEWAKDVFPDEVYVRSVLDHLNAACTVFLQGREEYWVVPTNNTTEDKLDNLIQRWHGWREVFLRKSQSEVLSSASYYVTHPLFDGRLP